ncbi:MAG: bifunctional riboflavin kinase/FAD synthetase [Actinomycetota bacterium]|jgi:riboflavin kinase/FMN adenylyltransferase|nr:bifunctional riboflavin kinase/FAD synthetase [Actinomycetota bacterium]
MLKIIRLNEIKNNYYKEKNIVVIGFFDGVHKGHENIIKKCVEKAMLSGKRSIALTFDRPPKNIITGRKEKKLIISFKEKIKIISSLGIKQIVSVSFDKYFANLTPRQFCEDIIINKLNAAEVFVGENFKFGKDASGDTDFLNEYFLNSVVKINIINLLKIKGQIVSSTEIRRFYEKGDIDNIKLFMGRYPSISGKVVRGFNRGSRIGFPTANIELDENYMIPKKGVYFAKINIQGYNTIFPSVVNIGNNPTFGIRKILLEAHIIEFKEEIYNRLINVELIKFHRQELKFQDESKLIKQINSDIKEGIEFFKVKNYNDIEDDK